MTLNQRSLVFVRLGELFTLLGQMPDLRQIDRSFSAQTLSTFDEIIVRERAHNGWFTEPNVRQALAALGHALDRESLANWLERYALPDRQDAPKRVGLVLAGNIPLVGFHDLMCTLLCGHIAVVKASRDDDRLLPAIMEHMFIDAPELRGWVEWAPQRLNNLDAIIATGSNTTAKHFDYYFRDIPRVIRQSRTSVAVLDGTETHEELSTLGHDIFDYFGLGCRNVTKLLIPKDFDLDRLFGAIFAFKDIVNHNKYGNNYDYHKALWLLNRDELIENGFLMIKEDRGLVSPVGSLFVERYTEYNDTKHYLAEHQLAIQCVIGHDYLPFGKAQRPELDDYADGVDTLEFLKALH